MAPDNLGRGGSKDAPKMTYIGAKVSQTAHLDDATELAASGAQRLLPVALTALAGVHPESLPAPQCADMPFIMAPPTAPQVPIDAHTLQAMTSFEAEIGQMCTHWARWAAAEDKANADRLQQHKAAALGTDAPLLAHVSDGGLHLFMRLRLENAQSGAAELRRLAQASMAAQDTHLAMQQVHQAAATETAHKMQRWMGVAHTVTAATHGIAVATGCAVGAALALGAATPMAAVGATGLTLLAALGGSAMLGGCAPETWLQVAALADMAALSGLLLMTSTQANPTLAPLLIATKVADGLCAVGTQTLQSHFDTTMQQAQAQAHHARVQGTIHERGYTACMDAVQRMSQSHGRALSIILAMLRSSQQVSLLQSRNLRK